MELSQKISKKRYIKKVATFLIWLLLFFTVITAIIFAIFLVYEPKLKSKLIEAINEELIVPVEVKNGIDYTIISTFPELSINFKKVVIKDNLRKGENLLDISRIQFRFSILDIASDKLEIKKIVFAEGNLNIFTNKTGKQNFNIFKQSKSSNSKSSITIHQILFSKINIQLQNNQSQIYYNGAADKIAVKINANNEIINVTSEGNVYFKNLKHSELDLKLEKTIGFKINYEFNKISSISKLSNSNIFIGTNHIDITGIIAKEILDLKLLMKGESAAELLQLLPDKIAQQTKEYRGDGIYTLKASIKGSINNPNIILDGKLEKGELKSSLLSTAINDININFSFNNLNSNQPFLNLNPISFSFNNEKFSADFKLNNLKNPNFELNANGKIDLSIIKDFISDTMINELGGIVSCSDIKLSGNINKFKEAKEQIIGYGVFSFENVFFTSNNVKYEIPKGSLTKDSDRFLADDFQLKFLESDINFSGQVKNLIQFSYNLSKFRTSNGIVLGVLGNLEVSQLNLEKIIRNYSSNTKSKKYFQREKIKPAEVINMQGQLNINIKKLIHKKLEANNVKCNVSLVPGKIIINDLNTSIFNGKFECNGFLEFTEDNDILFDLKTNLTDIDIPTLFKQAENFNQEVLTYNHLSGRIVAEAEIKCLLKNLKELSTESIISKIKFRIDDGRLKNFEPLRQTSKFIKVDELNDIKFTDFHNELFIENEVITIPEMEIKSNALNLYMFGKHPFNNIVDYHLKINLKKVLANKFSKSITKASDYIEEDPYNGLNLYLLANGPISNLSLAYDKKEASKKVKEDFKKEGQLLKDLINKEKNPPKVGNESEYKYYKLEEEPKEIEFEE